MSSAYQEKPSFISLVELLYTPKNNFHLTTPCCQGLRWEPKFHRL